MKIRRTPSEIVFQIFNYILLTVICIICLYPLWHVLMASISNPILVFSRRGFFVIPIPPMTLKGYGLVLKNPNIPMSFLNTLFYVVVYVALSMALTIMAAYTLSRRGLFWNRLAMRLIIFTMYFQGGMIPFYLMVRNMGLMNTRASIILPIAVNTWNLIVMRTAFTGVPDSLIESAQLDGASHFRIAWTLVVPLSKATVAVIMLFYAVRMWNEWFNPSLFLSARTKWPIQLFLRDILLKNDTSSMTQLGTVGQSQQESYRLIVKYCTIIVSTVPILILYPFLQRYFISGIMIGSVKE